MKIETSFLGLLILGICIGNTYTAIHGWGFIGCGFIALGLVNAMLSYLAGNSKKKVDPNEFK